MSRLSAIVFLFCLCHVCVQSFHLSFISSRFTASRHSHTLCMSSAEGGAVDPVAAPSGGLKAQLMTDMKDAMKAKDKVKLSGVRAIQAAIKQREIDDRIVVNDDEAILIMSKLIKQIRESIKSYGDAGRQDLVDKEQAELDVVTSYMPVQLSAEDVEKMIDECIAKMGATTIKDMGKVMAELKPVLAGKTDTAAVGALIKKKLGGK